MFQLIIIQILSAKLKINVEICRSKTRNTIEMDTYGKALMAYYEGEKDAVMEVHCSLSEPEQQEVSVFFREFAQMPSIEKVALKLCRGTILDVGAGSGIHALELQKRGFDITAIDLSHTAVELLKQRGLTNVFHSDFFQYKGQKFDTILLLMNGLGLVQSMDRLPEFFEKLKTLLQPGGQVLFDSSDLIYMFEEEDGSYMIDLNANYYGEVEYRIDYKKERGEPFRWLYIDIQNMTDIARQCGFDCTLIEEDEHYHYLARLTHK